MTIFRKNTMRILRSIMTVWLSLAFTEAAVWGAGNGKKLSPDLQSLNPSDNVDVIITYNTLPAAAQDQKIKTLGGTAHSKMSSIRAGHYTVPASALQGLSDDADIVYISPDRPVSAHLDQADATVGAGLAYRLLSPRENSLFPGS